MEVLEDRTFGLDASKYQLTWRGVPLDAPWRPDFIIQRLSYGGREDERREALYADILRHGPKARGAYHYGSTGVYWKAQCDLFLRLYLEGDYHMAWWDFEEAFNNVNQTYVNETFKAMEYIRADLRGRGRPDPVGLYTGQALFVQWFRDRLEEARDFALWFAQYWYLYSPTKNPGLANTGLVLEDLDLWQYSADAVQKRTFYKPYEDKQGEIYGFGSRFLDLNVYPHGNRAVFARDFLGRPTLYSDEPAPPEPTPEPQSVKVVLPDMMRVLAEDDELSATYVKQ